MIHGKSNSKKTKGKGFASNVCFKSLKIFFFSSFSLQPFGVIVSTTTTTTLTLTKSRQHIREITSYIHNNSSSYDFTINLFFLPTFLHTASIFSFRDEDPRNKITTQKKRKKVSTSNPFLNNTHTHIR